MSTHLPFLLATVAADGAVATGLILVGALVLLATEWVRPDVTAMAVVLSLFLTGVLTPEEALAGLGNPVVVTIAAMFVLGHAVLSTGAASRLEHAVMNLGGQSESGLIAVSFLAVALLSAWVQNIAGIVLILPAIIGVARRRGLSASRLLLPLAAASLTGGMCTLVGSPANLALDGKLREMAAQAGPEGLRADLAPVGMFETLGIGLAMTGVGVLYYAFVGPKLLPARLKEESLSETYEVKEFLTEVRLGAGSDLVGQKLVQAKLSRTYRVTVMGIERDGTMLESPDPWTVMKAGDVLQVQGESDAILRMRKDHGMDVPAHHGDDEAPRSADLSLAEIMPSPSCRLVNRALRDLGLGAAYGLHPLAVAREGEPLQAGIGDVPLRTGDVILVQGHDEGLARLRKSPDWVVLQEGRTDGRPLSRALIASGILVAVIAL
ncbi:MAG: SLC13 family permease, partial [Planctomycetota bacterium]